MARLFKDNASSLKIAIVVDMWLTGFDVPSLATMYVYKPMSGHNLMQAIARVNRVFGDKEGGWWWIMWGSHRHSNRPCTTIPDETRKTTVIRTSAKRLCPNFRKSCPFAVIFCMVLTMGRSCTAMIWIGRKASAARPTFCWQKALPIIKLADDKDTKEKFIKEALLLRQALSLCASLVNELTRLEAAFFEAVRTVLVRLASGGTEQKLSLDKINTRINELLKQSIKSDGVINLFSDIQKGFSLFDPKFLEEIASMKEKNLAIEILKKLIAEQVSVYRRTNVVRSEKFSEIIQRAMNQYLNGMLTNEEVIQELLKLADDITAGNEEGESLALRQKNWPFMMP